MPSSRDSGSFPAAPPGDNWQVTNSTSRARFYAGRADFKRYNSDGEIPRRQIA